MKNIPLFTSEYGAATLILEEIPHKQVGFVLLRSQIDQEKLLGDCRKFCVMCGAEQVYATGDVPIHSHPKAYEILSYTCPKAQIPSADGTIKLVEVAQNNIEEFVEIHNKAFQYSLGNTTYGATHARQILEENQSYLGFQGEHCVGIGQITATKLQTVGVLPQWKGMGTPLTKALLGKIQAEKIEIEVSSINSSARKLYEKLGFTQEKILAQWHKIEKKT